MEKMILGDVEVSRVVEYHGAFGTTDVLFPSVPAELWRRHESWLAPDFLNAGTGEWQSSVQTWVLRSAGRTVLVDTGLGDTGPGDTGPGGGRPSEAEAPHRHDGDLLDRLAAMGVRPQDVDLVVNTHLHDDHVGWNTRLVDGEWVPTFPHARYLISRADFDFWNPANGHAPRFADTAARFDDSVLPVHRAGQTVLWEGDSHRIDEDLVLEPAPGHTPGSAVLRLESGTDRALFVGDVIHTPLQMIEPDHDICVSEDRTGAARSRRRVLEQAAATNSLVVPAHLGGAGAAEVVRSNGAFSIKRWAPLSDA
ncbi:glyoxylase-like metal-dependent hydrolase (beta-lactamase superfamily II) [Streptomyces sp. V3I8]|uniref:MBL fold metallo-hydrolase n=1 Tax=Streptomyces sp. V3I8 TaxID=3042279 RepID=UPI0027878696|nr:MBL fold metallo-hydrolase [Streptomyces sp. V3I8]MDQ1037048.1 glyoxylase-like metal-dependent hydrolase (beta-lactamase superfamily II) [Streptomyces sp. V3I8]